MPSFVVQEHFTEPHHYDLMLERGEALATWAVPVPPEEIEGAVEAPRLADHRRRYLTYEGEIGGGRGRVRIHDRGAYEEEAWEDAEIRVTLAGERLSGTWRLTAAGRDDARGRPLWRIERVT